MHKHVYIFTWSYLGISFPMWESHMILMGFPLVYYGTPMAHLGVGHSGPSVSWESHMVCGTPTSLSWNSHAPWGSPLGRVVGLPKWVWEFHQSPLGVPLVSYGSPLIHCGNPMIVLWDSHDSPVGLPLVPMGVP